MLYKKKVVNNSWIFFRTTLRHLVSPVSHPRRKSQETMSGITGDTELKITTVR